MNALWINRISNYKNSKLCLETVKVILSIKTQRQGILMRRYGKSIVPAHFENKNDIQSILLEEARVAHIFWTHVKEVAPQRFLFSGRKQEGGDIVNKLLNIGYHHLKNKVTHILHTYNISPEIGLFHTARSSKSTPLVYDLIEMFRSDVVDSEVLTFLRLKKKEFILDEKQISYFLHRINKNIEKNYYLKDFNMCHTYVYYMEVQILKFIKAINHKKIFKPIYLPTRHENRCNTNIYK